jgi:integrase
MADKLITADTIQRLAQPKDGNKFHGFAGWQFKDRSIGRDLPQGFGVVVTANGVRSFVLNYELQGKQRRYTIGRFSDGMTLTTAIGEAKQLREQIANKIDPMLAKEAERKQRKVKLPVSEDGDPATVRGIYRRWLKAPHHKGKLLTHPRNSFEKHILPALGAVPFRQVRKSNSADLYDAVTDTAGPVAANRAITYLQAVLNWQESRSDDYVAPRLRKLATYKETRRNRVLSDDEICKLWPVWEAAGAAGQLCRLLLLTGCRRSEVADLTWADIDFQAATATIPAARYKTGVDHTVALSEPVLAILAGIKEAGGNGERLWPKWGFARVKDQLDDLAPAEHWTFHDLRRTAKTLMMKAGVLPHISERVLGHAQGVIEGTYDTYDYLPEKRTAVDKLARAIERILSPEPAQVVRSSRFGAA